MISIPLAFAMTILTPSQGPPEGASLAPVVGEEVAVVVRLDLTRKDIRSVAGRLLGKTADAQDVQAATKVVDDWAAALKKAGAREIDLLIDPTAFPGPPVAVVPLEGGGDGPALVKALTGDGPLRWPAAEVIRGFVAAGTPEALARLRDARPEARADLAPALGAGKNAIVKIAILPSRAQRRALEEAMPAFPPQLGGGPVTGLTKDLRWASIALEIEPSPAVRVVVQAEDADAARRIAILAKSGLNYLGGYLRADPTMAGLADAIGRVAPRVQGDRVLLDADLEKAAELVAIPINGAREAARRSQCVNNLKQLGLAMHNFHQAHDRLPAAYTEGADKKPLLSWRVQVLPYLEQKPLYDEFHHDEPWDSPHNKALIARMPSVYACPSVPHALAEEGKTTYLTPRSPASMFPGGQGVKFSEVADGLSNTIMVMEAGADLAVTWTKPDDWAVPAEIDPSPLFGTHPGGTEFLWGDGSVKFIKQAITPSTLKKLVTRNGGEPIKPEDY